MPSAQPSNLGAYSVGVTNSAGGIVSSNAMLRLNVPAPTLDSSSPGLLRWQGLSNLTYTIQNRTNLALGDWQTLGGTSSPDGTLVFPLPNTNVPKTFSAWFILESALRRGMRLPKFVRSGIRLP